jgi:capsular exopolysaccharide synthesis family protein
MELRRYAAIVWRWSWLLALGTLLAGAASYAVSKQKTPIYQANATILVNQAQALTGPSYSDVLANQQLSKTYAQLVTSSPVLDQVVKNLGASGPAPAGPLPCNISAAVRRDTQLIDIKARSTDPALASRCANETAKVFSDQIRQTQLGQQSNAEGDLEQQISAVQKSIDDRQRLITSLGSPQPGVPEDQRRQQLNQAQNEIDGLRQNHSDLTRRLQDLRIDLARSINSVTLADPAGVPIAPVSPRVALNTALGAFLGLVIAAAVVGVMEYLDDTVKSAEDVSRAVGAATLGAITRFRAPSGTLRRGHRGLTPRLLTSLSNTSTVAEAYRMVRTNLEFARSGRTNQTMLVTSALPGEGKSTTTANLALVLAQTGRRVILVDADLRRPSQHRLFDVPNTVGLSTLFVMDEPVVEGFLRMTPLDNLLVLPSGPLPPNPAELMSSSRMGQIIEMLKKHAEIVLFDSPPLLGVADASALAPRLDGAVLVVDSGRTRAGVLTHAVEVLGRAQATLWGVVLNKLKTRRGEGYYYYYNYRYYGSTGGDRGGGTPTGKIGRTPDRRLENGANGVARPPTIVEQPDR